MITVFLDPCDIVFFRDDLPFGARGNQVGRCQFPPRPSVIAGALRTKVLASQSVDFDDFRDGNRVPEVVRGEIGAGHGTEGGLEPGSFAVRTLSVGRRENGPGEAIYFRAGRDLISPGQAKCGASAEDGLRLLAPAQARRIPGISSLGSNINLPAIEPGMEPKGGWLEGSSYISYLLGRTSEARVTCESEILERDYRVGIGLDMTSRTVDEGRLFSSEGLVMKPGWGFVVGVEGCSLLPATGLVRLGGDGRMARLSAWHAPEPGWGPVRDLVRSTGRFRWVLQAPAIFGGGWLPAAVREEDGQLLYQMEGLTARVVSAAVGPPELAGGWDLVRRGPKPFRRMVPAGSVYWFEVIKGEPEAAWEVFHGHSVSDEKANEGFGLVHLGGWDYV
jgi:CRISPR-associated protein Cmr3